MKKMIMTALVAVLCACASMAGSISIVATNKDQVFDSSGKLTFVGQPNARVGNTTTPAYQSSFIIPFRLPALTAGSTISAVTLNVYCESVTVFATNIIHMQVLGGRVDAASTVSSNDWNYGSTLAANVESLYKIGGVTQVTAGAKSYTLDSAFFQSIYDNDPDAAGKHVFVTLYADGVNSAGANSYAVFTTADGATAANRPTLNFTTLDDVNTKLIETSSASLSITEGTTNSFQLRLNNQPAADVTVNVSRVSGDTNLQVLPDPTSLIFSAENWGTWQSVYVEALADLDTSNAVATIQCTEVSGSYTSLTVQATQIDITPVAAFTAVPTAGYAPLTVTFTDTSTGGITNRFWDFGDGETTNITTNVIAHTYTVAGTFTVQLVVNGPLGGSTASMTVNVPAGTMRDLPVYDSFNDEVSTNAIPAGWTCFAPAASNSASHSRIDSGSLSYPGLQASAGNSWGLGEKTDDYSQDFMSPNLGTNQTVYFSFLMRQNSPLNTFNSGLLRLSDRSDPFGSGVVVGWGQTDTNSGVMGFSLNNRNSNWTSAGVVKTPETYTAADTVYLVVAAYTRGTNATSGTLQLWINPDSATFGTETPPAPVLSTNSYASDANWNRLEFISNGSSAGVPNWQLDEVRIATNWAGVVPVYVAAAPVITSALNVTGTVGQAFSYQIQADNNPSGFDAAGLPEGMSINTNSGAITGTPVAAGSSDVTISASNMIGTDSQTLVLIIQPAAPVITGALTATGTVDQAFSYQITADNNPESFDAAGLPAGLSINTNNGAITGTPVSAGSNDVTISASNAGGMDSKTLVVIISPAGAQTDIDSDGLPNDWETLYFGGATNANPSALAANGKNTVMEAYVAGLDPTDPQSVLRTAGTPPRVLAWSTVSGRVYSVYASTNLMSGFACIASNLPWTQSSLTNSTVLPQSYFKIDVRME